MEKRSIREWCLRAGILMVALVGPVAGVFLPINKRLVQRLVENIKMVC